MIKRIVFLTEVMFNLRDYQRFGIEILQQNGFNVEVWDMTPVLRPKLAKNYTPPDIFDYNGMTLFEDEKEMCNKLSNLSNTDFVINFVSYFFSNIKVYRALSKSKANYAFCYANALPEPVVEKSQLDLLLDKVKIIASIRRPETWKRLFMKLPLKLLGIRPVNLVLAGGYGRNKTLYSYKNLYKCAEIMYIHTLDYDIYLKEKVTPCIEKPVAVFLDEFLPLHPEFEMLGDKIPINADMYYPLLNKFFDVIEEKTGFEVIIAAHPRATYEKLPDYFNGRTCVRGKTASLVKECKLVINHCTTAVNFANLFYKPAMFATCAALDNTYEDYWIREMAKWFGKKVVFMDKPHDIDFKKELNVDKEQYDIYRRAFIKADNTEDLPFWQVVANRLKKWKSI